ncbi:hypothetical protein ACE1SV_51140 [Streptomyces sennicomposti]
MPAEHPYLVPVGAQPLGDEAAERSGAAGHQDRAHAVPSLRTSASPRGKIRGVRSYSLAPFTVVRTRTCTRTRAPARGRGRRLPAGTDLLTQLV